MNIIVTGSLGNISRPLTQTLVQRGHSVTVISRDISKQKEIESLGARAAIGTMEDPGFLTKTFTGADVVYMMKPPFNIFDKNLDVLGFYTGIAKNYAEAIATAGIKKVVHLSSVGAHTREGVGMLRFHQPVEDILNSLPGSVHIKSIRPVVFYTNMYQFIPTIKAQLAIFQNFGGDGKEPWVSPLDIADAIAEEIETPFEGRTFRYVASDEVSPNEIAAALGGAIGQPGLKWVTVSDEQLFNGMVSAGMSRAIAEGFVDTNRSRVNGVLYEDFYRNKPTLGKVKLADFAQEFASVYAKQ